MGYNKPVQSFLGEEQDEKSLNLNKLQGPLYEAKSAQDKQMDLWEKITEDQSSWTYPSPAGIFLERMSPTFEQSGDIMPTKRTKYIHGVGATGNVRFDLVNHATKYTGIFGKGGNYGLIRLSSAAKPSKD